MNNNISASYFNTNLSIIKPIIIPQSREDKINLIKQLKGEVCDLDVILNSTSEKKEYYNDIIIGLEEEINKNNCLVNFKNKSDMNFSVIQEELVSKN